jgi:chromatin remodeling complex protein RSC6
MLGSKIVRMVLKEEMKKWKPSDEMLELIEKYPNMTLGEMQGMVDAPTSDSFSSKMLQDTPSDELKEFLSSNENANRFTVSKLLLVYIKENGLQDPNNRSEFFPNEKLRKLIGEPLQLRDGKKVYKIMSLQMYIKRHF